MTRHRVIQWGTGAVGMHALNFILDHDELELVGVKVLRAGWGGAIYSMADAFGLTVGYRIEIDGLPPYRGDFPLANPGGAGYSLDDAVIMTAARCVNAIGAVVDATPGYKTVNDLRAFGARYGMLA